MRITFVTTKFDFEKGGGSTPELDQKIRALEELGHTVRAVTLFSQNNRGGLPAGYPVSEEYIGTSGQLKIQWGAYRMLKKYEHETDLYHVDGVVFLYGAGLYRLLGGKKPVTAHFNREQSSFPDSRAEANDATLILRKLRRRMRFAVEKTVGVFLGNHIDLFTFTSPLLQQLYNRFGLEVKRSVIAPDFVDGTVTHARKVGQEAFTILCSGRMVREKGFDLVVRAAAELTNKKNIRFILNGDGPELRPLKSLARELGVEKHLEFPGWVPKEKLFEFMQVADIFILPRWRPELASILLFEAMSFGLACIVPAESTLSWSAGDGALTFKDEDSADLARIVQRLLKDTSLRENLSMRARRRLKEIDYRTVVKHLDFLLRNLLKRSKT